MPESSIDSRPRLAELDHVDSQPDDVCDAMTLAWPLNLIMIISATRCVLNISVTNPEQPRRDDRLLNE